jgi:hypothetical protein
MRLLLILVLGLITHEGLAQKYYGLKTKGYGQLAFSLYGNDEISTLPGISIGAGVLLGNNVTTGAGFDIYMINPKRFRFSQAYADFRAYYSGLDKAGPYISFQPGVVLLKREPALRVKSGFSMNILAGYFVKVTKSFGVTASLGYGMITYPTMEHTEKRLNGIKFNVGLCF